MCKQARIFSTALMASFFGFGGKKMTAKEQAKKGKREISRGQRQLDRERVGLARLAFHQDHHRYSAVLAVALPRPAIRSKRAADPRLFFIFFGP